MSLRRFFALTYAIIFAASICSAAEFRKWGMEDIEWGYGTWTSTGGVTSTKVPYPFGGGADNNALMVDARSYGTITYGSGASSAQKTANAAAIQAAIDASTTGQSVALPPGIIYIDGGSIAITASQTGVSIKGAGVRSTQLYWDSGVAIKVGASGGAMSVHNKISNLQLTGRGTGSKTGVQLLDTDGCTVENLFIYGEASTNKVGTGLEVQGRDIGNIRNLTINADKPIHIKDNPNSVIDIDHFHFSNIYLTVTDNTQYCVTIDDGVNLSNVIFDGYQAWVQGKGGLYWNDTTTTQVSYDLILKNIRWEQATDDGSGWIIYINKNADLQQLYIENLYGTETQDLTQSTNGIYLHNVLNVEIRNSLITAGQTGSSRTTLSLDNTTYPVVLTNIYWFPSGVKTIGTGLNAIEYLEKDDQYGVIRAIYDTTSSYRQFYTEKEYSNAMVTIDNGAVSGFGSLGLIGILNIVEANGPMAIYNLRGNAATVEVSDTDLWFSPTSDNTGYVNIYYSATNSRYEIQNLYGVQLKFRWFIVGGTSW